MISEELQQAFNDEEGRCILALSVIDNNELRWEAERKIRAAFIVLRMKTEFEPYREFHHAWKLAVNRGETFKSLAEFAKGAA